MSILAKIGRLLAGYLEKPSTAYAQTATCRPELLAATIRAGDVLLVDGSSRVSTAIKYLTQSTWSHAAMCVVDDKNNTQPDCNNVMLIEADVLEGVRTIPLANYAHLHTRICRPVGLDDKEITQAIGFIRERLGHQYDTKNVFDLVRYLFQTPPVPTRWRRKMIGLGSGDPTRAICSSLVAQTFQSIRYPILPDVSFEKGQQANCNYCYDEVLHIRHHTLYVPRDFDISPYFEIVKPTLNELFDPHELAWSEHQQN
jgi:hypothetical protein